MNITAAPSLIGIARGWLLQNSVYLRTDISKVVLGAATGRCIAAASLPVLTRLFSAEDYLIYASFMAIVTTVSIGACLRLEVLIPLMQSEKEAGRIVVLCVGIATIVTLMVASAVVLWPHHVAGLLSVQKQSGYEVLIPVAILAAAIQSVCRAWATRKRRFGSLAYSRVSQSGSGAAVSALAGVLGVGAIGLVIGGCANLGAGCGRFLREMVTHDRRSFADQSIPAFRKTIRRYRWHATLSTCEAVGGVAGVQLPLLAIAYWCGADAGHLCLALQILAVPMTLLGTGVGQVYLAYAGDAKATGGLASLTLHSLRTLLIGGVGPVLLAGALAPYVIPVVLGPQWARTGAFVSAMSPCIAMQLLASPVVTSLYVTSNQRLMLILTMLGTGARLGATCGMAWLGYPGLMVHALSWAGVACHMLQLAAVVRVTEITLSGSRQVTAPLPGGGGDAGR